MKGMKLFYRESYYDDPLLVDVLSEPYQVISSRQEVTKSNTYTNTAGTTCVICKSEHSDLMIDTPVSLLSLKGEL
jgi:hypothetical protein